MKDPIIDTRKETEYIAQVHLLTQILHFFKILFV